MENNNNNNKRKKETSQTTSSSMSGGNGSRWQPTKEQIEILESVYSAGVKTPSAEQIQQITSRLTVYGHIEGKNVFYWFQNTKARRRQKLKQDRLAFLSTTQLHRQPPPHYYYSPPFIPNVECGYYYYPYEQVDQARNGVMTVEPTTMWVPCESRSSRDLEVGECKKTLELFPLTPGGGKMGISGENSGGTIDSNCWDEIMNDEYSGACKDGNGVGYIDFFSTHETEIIN